MPKKIHKFYRYSIDLNQYVIAIAVLWTIVTGISLAWNVRNQHQNALKSAWIERRVTFNKEPAYREWAAERGDVHTTITEKTHPNPYLKITGTSIIHLSISHGILWFFGIAGMTATVQRVKKQAKKNQLTEQYLRETEERLFYFQKAIDSASDAIGMSSPEGKHYYQNKAFDKLFGLSVKEVEGAKGPPSTVYVDEKVGREIFETIMGGNPWIGEVEMLDKNGHKLDILLRGYPIKDEKGKNIGLVGMHTDITERKQAEEELLRHASITSSSSDMMAMLDTNFVYLAANEAYLAAFGLSKDEVVGNTVLEVFGKEFFETIIKPNAERCLKGNKVRYENWFQFPVHGSRFMLISYSPYISPDGDITGFVVNARDITEYKQAQEQIENLSRFPSENPNPVLRISRDGELLYANDASSLLSGLRGCETGKPVGDNWKQMVRQAFEKGSEERVEVKDNKRIYSFAVTPVSDGGYANLYGRDITGRKRAEKEREELLKVLENKNKELQSIVYAASHDLRSPLVNIKGFSDEMTECCSRIQNLLEAKQLDKQNRIEIMSLLKRDVPRAIGFIAAGTEKMNMLINGLLQVARIGASTLNIQPLNMNKILKQIVESSRYQIKEHHADVTVEDLPYCSGDEAKTSQVFSNLLDNALKYLDSDRKGMIKCKGWTENNMCVYCVEDNGLGFDSFHQDKIFEIFHRLNPKDSVGGEGLGLAIVLRILDLQNGKIWVESEPGKGSKFFVSLPKLSGL